MMEVALVASLPALAQGGSGEFSNLGSGSRQEISGVTESRPSGCAQHRVDPRSGPQGLHERFLERIAGDLAGRGQGLAAVLHAVDKIADHQLHEVLALQPGLLAAVTARL